KRRVELSNVMPEAGALRSGRARKALGEAPRLLRDGLKVRHEIVTLAPRVTGMSPRRRPNPYHRTTPCASRKAPSRRFRLAARAPPSKTKSPGRIWILRPSRPNFEG